MMGRRRAVELILAGFASLRGSLVPAAVRPMGEGAGPWESFPSTAVWRDFELVTGNMILLPAEISGLRLHALLDSGTSVSILSSGLAARVGLVGDDRTIRGNSGRVRAQTSGPLEITLLGERRLLPRVIITDLSTAFAALGRPIDFVAGEDVLAGRAAALDFAGRRIGTAASGAFRGSGGWVPLPLARGANRELTLPVSIGGLPSAPFVFDLGSASALILSKAFVDASALAANRALSTAATGGVEGIRIAEAFTLDGLVLGGLSVRDIPALAVDPWLSSSAVGSVGLPLIAQFDVILDVSADTVWLRRSVDPRRPPMLKDRSGLGLQTRADGLIVVHVARGSPAERVGFEEGDRIVAVDGHAVDRGYTHGELWRWRFGPAGTRVSVLMANGQRRDLRLADYY